MLHRYLLLLCILFFGFAACRDDQKEKALIQREEALLHKERAFALKEADYRALIGMRDSLLAAKDTLTATLPTWPALITGSWNSKIICKESNCSDYVIGDQRNERWEFTSDSTGSYVKVFNNQQLSRTFKGTIKQDDIQLHFATDSTAKRQVAINVSLSQRDSTLMKGIQHIEIDQQCTANFSVELVRAPNP